MQLFNKSMHFLFFKITMNSSKKKTRRESQFGLNLDSLIMANHARKDGRMLMLRDTTSVIILN